MYTVEFEPDAAIITVLCENDEQEDIEMIIGDDGAVFIRQYQEYKNEHDVITMTYEQLKDLVASLGSAEGFWRLK